jgi:glycosyltransferase involved in cell wall biosynthesis
MVSGTGLAVMARIVIATSHPPFSQGGHLVIADALALALRQAGHDATVLLTPQNRFGRQGSAYFATWLTDVGVAHDGSRVDQIISLRFPSYAIRHPRHVCWLNHRMREYYDQWMRFSESLSHRARVKELVRRQFIHLADRYFLTRNVKHLFVQSRTIQDRLERWGGIPSQVIYPPPPQRAYRCDGYGDELLVVSRLTSLKRVNLVIEALAQPEAAGVRCVIVGDGDEGERLRQLAVHLGVERRITFLGAVGDDALLDQLSRCRAVCFPASQEDYGLVTVEAFASSKAVITCSDSGGPAELVTNDKNGYITEPSASALAKAMVFITEQQSLAERLGIAARKRADELTWDHTVQQLLLV